MSIDIIGPEAESLLTWDGLTTALAAGHRLPRAEIADVFLYRGKDTLLSRAAWIDGLGQLVKTATIFPGNAALGKGSVNGAVTLFSDRDGTLEALVDFHLVTKWKTAGDSLLAAKTLARKDSREILIVGAGAVARSMIEAYASLFHDARFTVWNRSGDKARAMEGPRVTATEDLEAAVRAADIICTATMSHEPVVKGAWLKPGTHLDLIGAYRPDMREVDDEALRRATIFVDSRATTIGHIGEIRDPIARGVISEADIRADYYDLASGAYARSSDDEITLAKNGGGAHLDLMTASYIAAMWRMR
ncbi:ornithine cyclodeaminase [Cereibacter sphaeroides]|uniref:ornithine cyclodeaminase family protein n=1 Tax=Cereibacter sphaeroides TaxID=1063 RepID=UPI001F2A12C7|nr:ornithine cyclodeaminase [Cereibacter sphaeroides]MCE6958453.1 ornithine cyclodeaminase [Cereibacter sphaeroides]MCE6967757.1 ornithine cyclodeaminase [Cereibacter sphaeroides]MCE6972658.1 ornithine cyclodeaminase [Cereibacter sphaeroides]